MKFSKGMLVLATSLAFAGVAKADDAAAPAAAAPAAAAPAAAAPAVKAENKSGIQTLLPGAYSSVEMRHTTDRTMAGDKVKYDAVNITARPTLGTSLFDGKVDTSFTWIFSKSNGTTEVKKADLYNDSYLTLLDSEAAGSLKIEAFTYQGTTDRFVESDWSLNFESPSSWELPTAAGKLGLYVFGQAGAALTNGQDQPKYQVERTSSRGAEYGLTTADDGSTSVKARDPQLFHIVYVNAYVKPLPVAGLKLSVGSEEDSFFTPHYKEQELANESRTQMNGYSAARSIINKYGISYKLNDKVSLINQLRQNIGGYYEKSVDGIRWENRLILTATLM